jgi:hypothetical protein
MFEDMGLKIGLLLGFGVMKLGVPGISPFSMDKTTFISPDSPDAASEWPILLFTFTASQPEWLRCHPSNVKRTKAHTEPTIRGLLVLRVGANANEIPFSSIGSPTWNR